MTKYICCSNICMLLAWQKYRSKLTLFSEVFDECACTDLMTELHYTCSTDKKGTGKHKPWNPQTIQKEKDTCCIVYKLTALNTACFSNRNHTLTEMTAPIWRNDMDSGLHLHLCALFLPGYWRCNDSLCIDLHAFLYRMYCITIEHIVCIVRIQDHKLIVVHQMILNQACFSTFLSSSLVHH